MGLIDRQKANELFDPEWPIYTRTNNSSPTHYYKTANIKSSVISNGCMIEGTVENSIVGRGCIIKKGAVIKNSIISTDVEIGENVHVENQVVDKHSRLIRVKEVISAPEHPGYIKRGDTL